MVILDGRDGKALCGLSNHKFFKGDFDGQGGCGCALDFTAHSSDLLLVDTGTKLNADLSSSLLVTIFSYDTPLHDGAVIVQGGKILGAGAFLPLSKQPDITKTFGTRHRAAIGVTEETDALVVIVSEETGAISIAYDSKLYYDLTMEQLTKTLEDQLEIKPDAQSTEEVDNDAITKA